MDVRGHQAAGRADRITTFFEGTSSTMDVEVYRDGSVYVATRNEIFRLRDSKGTGVGDERTEIAHLETDGNYPHNGLSGISFDFHGDLYFGIGDNLGRNTSSSAATAAALAAAAKEEISFIAGPMGAISSDSPPDFGIRFTLASISMAG